MQCNLEEWVVKMVVTTETKDYELANVVEKSRQVLLSVARVSPTLGVSNRVMALILHTVEMSVNRVGSNPTSFP